MKKKWCRHIKWLPRLKGGRYWESMWFLNNCDPVPANWKVCPICLAERPTEANIAAATHRALMGLGDEE